MSLVCHKIVLCLQFWYFSTVSNFKMSAISKFTGQSFQKLSRVNFQTAAILKRIKNNLNKKHVSFDLVKISSLLTEFWPFFQKSEKFSQFSWIEDFILKKPLSLINSLAHFFICHSNCNILYIQTKFNQFLLLFW